MLSCQLAGAMDEHRSLPPSSPWAGRDGEGRSGSKGGEGPARGGNRRPRAGGVPFSAPTPPLSAAAILKNATKPPAPSSTDSSGVAIPNAQKPESTPLHS